MNGTTSKYRVDYRLGDASKGTSESSKKTYVILADLQPHTNYSFTIRLLANFNSSLGPLWGKKSDKISFRTHQTSGMLCDVHSIADSLLFCVIFTELFRT